MITSAGWTLFLQIALFLTQTLADIPPNIVFILADDLGWNDVGFHGSNEIPTPNIDALAFTGVILNNYYVMPICTPSRSALMTGKHPIHTVALHKLDESVGMVVEALSERKMLENTIIVFSSDNGGPAAGFNLNAASNWPLRGVKNTLWEGGVRGAGLIWSSAFENPGRVSSQLMDITDWLPTLVAAANGTFDSDIDGIDGQDVWSSLVSEDDSVNRTLLIHNIDDIYKSSAIRFGQWKLVKGTNYEGKWDGWYGPSGRNLHHYDIDLILNSHAGRALKKIHRAPTPEQISNLRRESEVVCSHRSSNDSAPCFPLKKPCLFNIEEDPCERYNLAEREPELLRDLLDLLRKVNETAVPPGNLPLDPQGLPQRWGYVWTNFGDLITENDVM